jgi:hypothetical protein
MLHITRPTIAKDIREAAIDFSDPILLAPHLPIALACILL